MRVAVVGDSCVDEFVYVRSERLAPDLPIPVVVEQQRVYNPGMAANVSRAINFHGVQTELFTPLNWESLTKTRIVDEATNYSFLRIDKPFGEEEFSPDDVDFSSFDAVVVSDYVKGFLSADSIETITDRHDFVFLDTKRRLGGWAEKAHLIKINEHELKASQESMTPTLLDKTVCTLGDRGALFQGQYFPVEKVEVRDTSGAGDSFLARLVAEVLRSGDLAQAIVRANESASAVVRMRGVGIA